MENPSIITLSSQSTLTRQMEVLSHNLANLNTPAFKAERIVFTEHMAGSSDQAMDDMGPMSFVQAYASFMDFAEGPMNSTGNPLDVALNGDGLFGVQTEDGVRFTRNGRFTLDNEGVLVTSAGLPVLADGGGQIEIGQTSSISIASDGTISTDDGIVARLQVSHFADPQQLDRGPEGLYAPRDGVVAEPVENPQVVQGMIEASNVSAILEMTQMIDVTRSYQRVSQMIQSEHERQQRAIQRLARAA